MTERVVRSLVTIGLHKACAHCYGGRGSILMFHRVVEGVTEGPRFHVDAMEVSAPYLELIVQYLKAHYDIISLDEVESYLREKHERRFVCLTFDDGYLDNYTLAYPVLKRHKVPFTLYLCTAYPDKTAELWPYALEDLVREKDHVELEYAGKTHRFEGRTVEEKLSMYEALWDLIVAAEQADDGSLFKMLFDNNGIELAAYSRSMTVDWEHVEEMSRDELVTIGAHTTTHRSLGELSSEEAECEILDSKQRIESQINRPVQHFSYPFGSSGAAGSREFEIVKRLGFKTATTTRRGNIFAEHLEHLAALPRLEVGRTRNDEFFLISQMSGLRLFLKGQRPRVVVE